MYNLLQEKEGAKPRKDRHVPLFEGFVETEDPDILRSHYLHLNYKPDKNHASIAYKLKVLFLFPVKLRSAAGDNKGI